MRKGKAGKRITPMVMILGVIGAGAIVAFAQGGKKADVGSKAQVNTDRNAAPAVTMVAAADRKPLSYYTGQVRSDLFTAAVPPAPAPPKPKTEAPKLTVPAVKPEIVNPLADYVYSGTVSVDNQQFALIENAKTRTGEYYKLGDSWMGGKIASIDERSVTLDVAGKKQMLAKSDNYQLTPLDKSAAFLQPNQQGQPGMMGPNGQPMPGMAPDPNNPNGGMGAMFQGGGRGGMRGNWANMTPEQQQALQQRFMNRQFNGGGRFGGFGGGGGGFGGGGGGGRRNRGGGMQFGFGGG